jgi:hypothetical protein
MSSGVDVVCWGYAVGPVVRTIDLFRGGELDAGAVSVRYDVCVRTGMSVWCMYVCKVWWTRVDDRVGSLGSL